MNSPTSSPADPAGPVIAVDWSGAKTGARRKLWLAEARGGRLVRLECGRTREALVDELAAFAAANPRLVVGLDFAFAFPAWFALEQGSTTARELWARVRAEGEAWLAGCRPPFWGRKGCRRPAHDPQRPAFRRTEKEHLPISGVRPKSVFQIGGAGAVGTGSIRGMPHLLDLSARGFSIWPFDPPRPPLVVEIYPRLLSGPVTKKSSAARQCFLQAHCADQPADLLEKAAASDDAFDAAVSALSMSAHAASFERLRPAPGPDEDTYRIEGRIWCPALDPMVPASALRNPPTPGSAS